MNFKRLSNPRLSALSKKLEIVRFVIAPDKSNRARVW